MKRPAFPKQKDCIIINDVPTKSEIKDDEIFGASSNLSMLTAFQRGKLLPTQSVPEGFQGISPLKIHTTYLSFEVFEEGNFDWGNYWKKRKDLQEVLENGEIFLVPLGDFEGSALENSYYKIPHQKDLFVHKKLFDNIIGTLEEIKKVQPKLVILTGKWATFLLTGVSSLVENYSKKVRDKPLGCIMKYRGSILSLHPSWELEVDCVVMPIIHPVNIWTMPVKIPIMLNDIHKLCWMFHVLQEQPTSFFKEPARTYIYGTDKKVILDYLKELIALLDKGKVEVSVDIETMFGMPPKKVKGKLVGADSRKPIIDCIGLAYEENRGICIPYCSRENPLLWSLEDEIDIQTCLNKVLAHPNILIEGQNYSYDYQYLKKLYRLETPPADDTMILSHTLFNNQPKDLATLASIFCPFYTYWKDESSADKDSPETRWIYNIKDILYTKIIKNSLKETLNNSPQTLQDFYRFKVRELLPAVFHTMELGVPVDIEKKESQRLKFAELMVEIEETINKIISHTSSDGKNTINLKSSTQVKKLFMDYFEVEPIKNRKTGTETFGNDAMFVYMEQYPLLRPLIKLILEYRSINVFTNTFLSSIVDEDRCLRSNLNVVGTATDRLASRKSVFGSGANLQNLPAGGKINLQYCLQSLEDEEESDIILESEIEGSLELPNIKELFICLEDEIYFDTDLAAADARVIAWTSECKFLTDLFNDPAGDPYLFLAKEYYKRSDLTKKSPERQNFKIVVHGCLTGDHEVLTKNGWVRIDEIDKKEKIAVWDKESFNIHFETPKDYYEGIMGEGEKLLNIKGDSFNQLVTLDHKFPYTVDKPRNLQVKQAINLPKSARIPYVGNYIGGKQHFDNDYVRLIVALQADGHIAHIDNQGNVTFNFNFAKQRKVLRLKEILENLGIKYREQKVGVTTSNNVIIRISFKNELEVYMKYLDWWVLDLSKENLETFVSELQYWDGYERTSNGVRTSITTTIKKSAEILQTVIQLTGKGSKIVITDTDITRKTRYEVSINNREFFSCSSGSKKLIDGEGMKIYCPITSTGFFTVRRNGHIMVTGNSNYGGKSKTLAMNANLLVHDVERIQKYYFGACPEIPALHKQIKELVEKRGYLENCFGSRGWFTDRNDKNQFQKSMAWVGSSPVSTLINKIYVKLYQQEKGKINIRLQVHDSLAGTFNKFDTTAPDRILEAAKVPMNFHGKEYFIPVGLKLSNKSYGNCSEKGLVLFREGKL